MADTVDITLRLRNARRFQTDAAKSAGAIRRLGRDARSSVKDTRGAFSGVSTAVSAAGAGAAAGLGYAVKSAMSFEKQLSSLGAVANANAQEMKALRASAMKAGADTAYSAREAAIAQTELAKGGLATRDILKGGLSGALALAAAGEMDLGEAASTTANALNLFEMRGSEATKVADAMAMAANSTTADVSDFSMALKAGGSVAKMAGYNFNETMVGLEALAAAGIKNSDAGTSMKAALLALAGPNKVQAQTAKALGLSFTDSTGAMKNASEMSADLRKALGGMGEAQRIATLKTLAGSDGVRYLSSLYAAGPKTLDKYAASLSKGGTAAEVARKKQDNLAGAVEQLKGSAETLAIQVGTALIPKLTSAAKAATRFINQMSSGQGAGGQFVAVLARIRDVASGVISRIRSFTQAYKENKTWAIVLASALGGLTTAFIALRVINNVIRMTRTLNAVMRANPYVLIASLLIGLSAALVHAYKKSETFRNIVNGVWRSVKSGAQDMWSDGIRPVFNFFKGAVDKVIRVVKTLSGVVKDVVGFFGDLVGKVRDVVDWVGKIKVPKINLPFGIGGAGNGTTVGPAGGRTARGVDSFTPMAAGMGLTMTSGLRPGDDGWHGQNRARDYSNGTSTPQMLAFARHLYSNFGSRLLELIYTPMGVGIKNGKPVNIRQFYGADVAADHFDHVHVAMRKGGVVPHRTSTPSVLYGEGRGSEYFIPTERQYRDRALSLWASAGQELGVGAAAPANAGTQELTVNVYPQLDGKTIGKAVYRYASNELARGVRGA